jgi:hypothetical protein
MAGKIKIMLESIIEQRGKGSKVLAGTTRTKLILRGFHPDKYDQNSPDEPEIVSKIKVLADELGVKV